MTAINRKTRLGSAFASAAFGALLLSACDLEVLNPGRILDEDLNTRELMPIIVSGASAEFNDIVDDYSFDIARLTDDLAGTGSYFTTGKYRRGVIDSEDGDVETAWEQAHEAAWAAGGAWERLQNVLEGDANSFEGAARLFVLMGSAHRMLGENFCEVTYDIGPLQPRTAAFDSAIAAFNQAVTIGSAAGATNFVTAAHGGIAQAQVGLGNWTAAAQSASMVADGVRAQRNLPPDGQQQRDLERVLGPGGSRRVGDAGPRRSTTAIPGAPYTICGQWNDTNLPPDPDMGVTPTGTCTGQGSGAHQGADGLTAHYRQDKYNEAGSDVAVVSGKEMRLIEAEAALMSNDLATFTAKINELRAHYDLDPIEQPANAGALEYPNAMDDAWSILDRERYLTLWMEGRRLWDLGRWNHPFQNGGTLIGPGASPRVSCLPIPEIECTLNPEIQNSAACT